MSDSEGLNYAPTGKAKPVCEPGELVVAATALDHGHIYGQCNGLREAGATLRWVFDPDPEKVQRFQQAYPDVKVADSLEQVLEDPEVRLVAAAAIPNKRGPLGCRVMEAGKDYFTDKTPFTTLEQLEQARQATLGTGRKYLVYYSERIHNESAVHAGHLIKDGAIGEVIQTIGTGPHRLSAPSRPAWFFNHEEYGGILCDIGSHQCEQFLYYTGATDAEIASSAVANYANPQYPELEDFGECSLTGNNGKSGYFRVDWFTPAGLSSWGDGRTIILGTKGYIELRKYTDITTENGGNQLLLVDSEGEHRIACAGNVGFPYFGEIIIDCLNRTDKAMTQEHTFKAAELCLKAQQQARHLTGSSSH